jgi:hypothetical protein
MSNWRAANTKSEFSILKPNLMAPHRDILDNPDAGIRRSENAKL